jgi:hypothetical protein
MNPIVVVLGGISLGAVAIIGALYWFVRRPPETGDHVSDEWRDDQIRGRRE